MSAARKYFATAVKLFAVFFFGAVWGVWSSKDQSCVPFASERRIEEFEVLAARELRSRLSSQSFFGIPNDQITYGAFTNSRVIVGSVAGKDRPAVHPWGTAAYVLKTELAGRQTQVYFDECGKVTHVTYPRDDQGNLPFLPNETNKD